MDPHYVPVGQLGYVVHKMTLDHLNAYVSPASMDVVLFTTLEIVRNKDFLSVRGPFFQGEPLVLEHHIPHGTPVMILRPAEKLVENDHRMFYNILWGEVICWVDREFIINPYAQGIATFNEHE